MILETAVEEDDGQKEPKKMTTPYSPFLDWIDSQKNTLLDRVRHWVAINSFSWNTEGLKELLTLIHTSFLPLKGESRFVNLSPQKLLSSDHAFHLHPLGQALTIKKRPHAPIQIVLGGHIDTVYPPSSPFQTIDESNPGIWKGPGSADMKGGIAILLTTLEALERSPFADQVGWEVILSPDEEIGSPGSSFLYAEAAKRHHCGLIFEPSFPDGSFVSERKGSSTYTILVKGKAAHVGRDYLHGRSAVFPLAHFIHKMEAFRSIKDLIVNIADVEGQGPVNIVPPFASCRVNLRSSALHILDLASSLLRQYAKECEEDGIEIEIVHDSFRPPKLLDSLTENLFKSYAQCADSLNIPFKKNSTGGVCDGNILANEGLPTLDTAGVVGGALHTPDEYLVCSTLVERAKLATLFLFKLANQDIVIEKKDSDGK